MGRAEQGNPGVSLRLTSACRYVSNRATLRHAVPFDKSGPVFVLYLSGSMCSFRPETGGSRPRRLFLGQVHRDAAVLCVFAVLFLRQRPSRPNLSNSPHPRRRPVHAGRRLRPHGPARRAEADRKLQAACHRRQSSRRGRTSRHGVCRASGARRLYLAAHGQRLECAGAGLVSEAYVRRAEGPRARHAGRSGRLHADHSSRGAGALGEATDRHGESETRGA